MNYKFVVIFLLNVFLAQPALAQATPPSQSTISCDYNSEQLMRLPVDEFDQDLTGGWRQVASQSGCEETAAELILAYINQNVKDIPLFNLHVMYWHVGQLEAFSGDYKTAIPFLMAGVSPAERGRDLGFYEYALGTIAFLNGDRPGLESARSRLARLPQPDWYQEEYQAGRMTAWPANLGVLDNLLRCFESPYGLAYANQCTSNP